MKQYANIAKELIQRASELEGDTQFWIGLAGGPGSGKSTLSVFLKEQLRELLTIIPMDGYHYYRSELDNMQDPEQAYARRGAPFTFNANKFVNALINARHTGEGWFPSFDHQIGDPVENDIRLSKGLQIVLVEGNYLLLDDEPWCQLRECVFDETWFLNIPLSECNRRAYKRHIKTGLTEKQAESRIDNNDSLNAQLIINTGVENADKIILPI